MKDWICGYCSLFLVSEIFFGSGLTQQLHFLCHFILIIVLKQVQLRPLTMDP